MNCFTLLFDCHAVRPTHHEVVNLDSSTPLRNLSYTHSRDGTVFVEHASLESTNCCPCTPPLSEPLAYVPDECLRIHPPTLRAASTHSTAVFCWSDSTPLRSMSH